MAGVNQFLLLLLAVSSLVAWFFPATVVYAGSFAIVSVIARVAAPLFFAKSYGCYMHMGLVLGRIVNPIVLSVIYIGVLFPTGLLFNLLYGFYQRKVKRDSYWVISSKKSYGEYFDEPF